MTKFLFIDTQYHISFFSFLFTIFFMFFFSFLASSTFFLSYFSPISSSTISLLLFSTLSFLSHFTFVSYILSSSVFFQFDYLIVFPLTEGAYADPNHQFADKRVVWDTVSAGWSKGENHGYSRLFVFFEECWCRCRCNFLLYYLTW